MDRSVERILGVVRAVDHSITRHFDLDYIFFDALFLTVYVTLLIRRKRFGPLRAGLVWSPLRRRLAVDGEPTPRPAGLSARIAVATRGRPNAPGGRARHSDRLRRRVPKGVQPSRGPERREDHVPRAR